MGNAALMVFCRVNLNKEAIWSAISLLGLLFISYGNSFHAAWHYDDLANIVQNDRVHMTHWSWHQVVSAVAAGPSHQTIARPLAYLSFAVNYKFGQLEVMGYHIVNFTIHWLASLFLFLFVRTTLTLPFFKGRYQSRAALIAWSAAVLWACHPIQVTAVTYIVQRMTSMAGLFYLMAMYSYVLGRRAMQKRKKWGAYAACAFSCAGALLTKENSVLLFYSILLYDLFFFQAMDGRSIRRTTIFAIALTLILFAMSFLYMEPRNVLMPYSNRPFSMLERLLTQPRVIFLYGSLLAVPMTMRMTIVHDFTISRTLLEPWTTMPAIAGLLLCIGLLCFFARKHRLFAFCGLFFFLNHAVESSFLNLDLIYEHRNYVPSMLLFLPVSMAVVRSIDYFNYRSALKAGIVCGAMLLLLSVIHTTYGYNAVLRSEYSLWRHTLALYPSKSISYVNMGKVFANVGESGKSYEYNIKAIEYDNFNNYDQKGIAHYNVGLYLASIENNLKGSEAFFREALKYNVSNPEIWHELAQVRMKMGDFAEATRAISKGLGRFPNDNSLLDLKALSDLKRQRYRDSIEAANKAIEVSGRGTKLSLMVLAQSHRQLGLYEKSFEYWSQVLHEDPESIAALMASIEMITLFDLQGDIEKYVNKLRRIYGINRSNNLHLDIDTQEKNMTPYLPQTELILNVLQLYSN